MSAFVWCPECESRVRLAEASTPGRNVRCPSCGSIFRPPIDDVDVEEEEAYERRRRGPEPSRSNSNALLIALLVGGGLFFLFVCAGVGIALFWTLSWSRRQAQQANQQPIIQAQVTRPVAVEMEEQKEDYARARKRFQTALLRQGPSPQPWNPVVPPADVREVEYVSGVLRLKAWISDPLPPDKQTPAVLYLHNGFAFGEEDWNQAEPFRAAGFAVMMPLLRGENGLPGSHSLYYDEVDDVVAAADTLAKLPGIDPKHLYIAGHAEGGTLALLAAMASKRFRAAGSFSASLDPNRSSVFVPVQAPFDPNDRQEFLMRSPLAYARSFKCPVRLYYGTGELGRGSDSQQTAERAKKAGLDVAAISVSGNEVTSVRPAMKRCIAFFEQKK